jgi:hypothetical protein
MWPGREANYSLPSSAEVKNEWSYTSTSAYAFMAVQGNFNFTFLRTTIVILVVASK